MGIYKTLLKTENFWNGSEIELLKIPRCYVYDRIIVQKLNNLERNVIIELQILEFEKKFKSFKIPP